MELMRIITKLEPGKIYGLMGNISLSTNNNNYFIINSYKFKGIVKEYLNSSKAPMALKMVMLNETYLEKEIANLSPSEIKKVVLAKALIENKDYLIFDYFDKDLTTEEKKEFKLLFKRLASIYQKTIILFTNELSFIWDISSSIIYLENENLHIFSKKDYGILKYVENPPIIEFINLMREKGIVCDNYQNTAIYRIKEQK